jgi:hypothetical protein
MQSVKILFSIESKQNKIKTIDLTRHIIMPVDNVATVEDVVNVIEQAVIHPNLPAAFANIPEAIQNIQDVLLEIRQRLDGMDQRLNALNGVEQRFDALDQRMNNIQQDMALVNNRACVENAHTLMPIRMGNVVVPATFPVDMGGLRSLSGPHASQCLAYYNLDQCGTVADRRIRLANHIGATKM